MMVGCGRSLIGSEGVESSDPAADIGLDWTDAAPTDTTPTDAAPTDADPPGDLGGDTGPNSISLETFCTAVAEAYGAFLVECFHYGADEGIVQLYIRQCPDLARRLDQGRLTYDGVRAAVCVDSLRDQTCGDYKFLGNAEQCQDVLMGTVPPGGQCYPCCGLWSAAAGECVQGYCRDLECPGICAAHVDEGGRCNILQELRCRPDLYCRLGTCRAFSREGEACGDGRPPCGADQGCDSVLGVCAPFLAEGEACARSEQCDRSGVCAEGVCRTRVEAGGPCRLFINCPRGDRCLDPDGPGGPLDGICIERGGQGAPCYEGLDCLAGFACTGSPGVLGECRRRPGLAQPCDTDGRCDVGLWCRQVAEGVRECAPQGGDGESCTESEGAPGPIRDACQEDLLCMSDGRCHRLGRIGEPCRVGDYSCEAELWCNGGGLCEEQAAQGEPCGDHMQCRSRRCVEAVCLPSNGCFPP
jgi:hypothetical protein